jgi:hypothetical protein
MYTQYDPYFYTVDNRPLGDLNGNDGLLATSADAGRISTLINALGNSVLFQGLYGTNQFMTGLALSNPSANTVRVGVGAVFQQTAIDSGISNQVMKMGMHPTTVDFSILAPTSLSNNVVYLIEGRYMDFGPNTSSGFPYFDQTNARLPETLLQGELQLQIKAGTQAPAGTELPPATDAGWFPIYNVTVAYGSTTFTAAYSTGSPTSAGANRYFIPLVTNGTLGSFNPVVTMAPSVVSSAYFRVPMTPDFNPYQSIKAHYRAACTTQATTGKAVVMSLGYAWANPGTDLTTLSFTTVSTDALNLTQAMNTVNLLSAANAIPPTGISSNASLYVQVSRQGTNASDTYTGTLNLVDINLYQ